MSALTSIRTDAAFICQFQLSCLQTFKRSSASSKRYFALSLFVPPSEETSKSIYLLQQFSEVAARTLEVTNFCSILHCNFGVVEKGFVAVFTQFTFASFFTFLLNDSRDYSLAFQHRRVQKIAIQDQKPQLVEVYIINEFWMFLLDGVARLVNRFTRR